MPVFWLFFCKKVYRDQRYVTIFTYDVMTQYVQCLLLFPRGGTVWYTMMTWCFTHNYRRHKTNEYHQYKFTGLNSSTAEHLLYAMKYKCHCHLMLDVINKLSVVKILNMKSLKTMMIKIICSYWTLLSFKR